MLRRNPASDIRKEHALFSEPLSRIALFFDFDGTLVRLADTPDAVEVPSSSLDTLDRMIERTGGAVAMISGRQLHELDGFLAPRILPGAGSHGVERRTAGGALHIADDGGAIDGARGRMRDHAEAHGLLFEEKRLGCAIHYRNAPELEASTRALVAALAEESDALRPVPGHMVAELSLGGCDKGAALDAFMREAPFAGRIPVAMGDDTSDEDAFRAAQARGGLGIRIGGTADTRARARFDDFDAFHHWLARTADSGTMTLENA